MTDTELKLFVWTNVLWQYGPGMMIALAHDVEEAKRLLQEEYGADLGPDEFDQYVYNYSTGDKPTRISFGSDPEIVTTPRAWVIFGSA